MKMPENPVRVLIADSQFLITESLKYLLLQNGKHEVSKVVSEKDEIVRILTNESISVLIIDPFFTDFQEITNLKLLTENFPFVKIIILVNSISRKELHELNSIGIANVVLKTASQQDISDSINSALAGKKYYSNELLDLVFDQSGKNTTVAEAGQLTSSELEIVRLISEGLTTKEIAARKFISFHTVISHRKNIFRKLGVKSVSELIMYGIKAGWITTIEYYI
jgi:DNA-binding NarL/FixJ family response regulator